MSQQAETIGDKVLTLNFLSERPEAQSTKALNLCLGHLTGSMSSLWEKKKILSPREVTLNFMGIMRQGKRCFDLCGTEEDCIAILFPVFHPRSAYVKFITGNLIFSLE